MDNVILNNEIYIQKINDILRTKKNAVVNIINDKLTLFVFTMLEKNLKNVKEINFIIRDTRTVPQGKEIEREFDIAYNPSEALFNSYDIVEKNSLSHFAKAKSMHQFISKYVNVRRTTSKTNIGINVLITDNEFMITGTSSLELSARRARQPQFNFNFDTLMSEQMDKAQIVGAVKTFERLWYSPEVTIDFKKELLDSLGYIYKEHSPEFLYYFTLNELFGYQLDQSVERLEIDNTKFKNTKIWNALYNFQKDCVWLAIQKLNKYNGCIIADSVGLGKTFEALAVIKYFELRNDNVLVLTPAKLYDNWMSFKGAYKDNSLGEDFHYKIMFHTDLSRYWGDSKSGYDLSRFDWSKFDLVVIDESHNFRNRTEKDEGYTRYTRLLKEVIISRQKTKVLLLSATPVNNSLVDLKNQISFITSDNDACFESEGIESISKLLKQTAQTITYWDALPNKNKAGLFDRLPPHFYKLLEMLTIARSRKHITTYYPNDNMGTFPEKLKPDTFTPDIDSKGELLKVAETNELMEALNLCVYTPMYYIKSEHKQFYREKFKTTYGGRDIFYQESRELITKDLHRFNLFKRLESSVYAFSETINRLIGKIDNFINALKAKSDNVEFVDEGLDDNDTLDYKLEIKVSHLRINDFLEDLHYDKDLLERLRSDVQTVLNSGRDRKLQQLKEFLREKITTTPYNEGNKKLLIFTAFADTAEYLFFQLENELKELGVSGAVVTGSRPPRVCGNFLVQEYNNILRAFSPISKKIESFDKKNEITVLIGTDCISEGQNLQDCDCVVNYDIHWNPVALIQRFGRIDRIGSKNTQIKMINFFPNVELNEYLDLERRIKGKMLSVNIAGTGDENILNPELNDISFRKRQLEKLRDEVIDIDEANEGISLTDMNMNEYLYELSQFIKKTPEIKKTPRGIFALTESQNGKGVIFCFKHSELLEKPKNDSSLYPYYLIYVDNDGKILIGNDKVRTLLKEFRASCIHYKEPLRLILMQFMRETKDATELSFYSELLRKAIASIQGTEHKKAEQTIFDFGGYTNDFQSSSVDDFELISFLVVK